MKLIGKTQRGRNIVQRDGSEWIVLERRESLPCFDGRPGWRVMSVSGNHNPPATRWIEPANDRNFTIKESTS